MLDVILKRIYKELPGTIAVTVHDSIMTGILTNNVEAVRKIIVDELTYFIGFQPQIKIERDIEENKEKEIIHTTSNYYPAQTIVSCN
jgi:predicted HAD superfamily phosphohydrolase YqeG